MLCFACFACGCHQIITMTMVHAPNRGRDGCDDAPTDAKKLRRLGVAEELYIAVGPPDATIRTWIINPPPPEAPPSPETSSAVREPRGTILVLHGYRIQAGWMRDTARDLAKAGYRAVIVDLRGHGKSSGDYISFGAFESADMVQVLDELERRGLIAGNVGVWGISMGGATAIQLAARDPRIKGVVAIAPYISLREVAPRLVRLFLPGYGWLVSDESLQRLVTEAAEEGGFEADDADTLAAMRRVRVPVLLMHGDWDMIVPQSHSRRLFDAAPPGSRFLRITTTGHLGAFLSDAPEREAVKWFDRWVKG